MSKVYLIVEIEVLDAALYEDYMARVPAVVEKYGGRYLVRGGRVVPLAGAWNPQRVIVLEFPSADHHRRFGTSPEYQELARLRERATRTRSIALEGVS